MQMQKTMMYLPQYMKDRIKKVAETQGTSQAEVMRAALEAGLEQQSLKKMPLQSLYLDWLK